MSLNHDQTGQHDSKAGDPANGRGPAHDRSLASQMRREAAELRPDYSHSLHQRILARLKDEAKPLPLPNKRVVRSSIRWCLAIAALLLVAAVPVVLRTAQNRFNATHSPAIRAMAEGRAGERHRAAKAVQRAETSLADLAHDTQLLAKAMVEEIPFLETEWE